MIAKNNRFYSLILVLADIFTLLFAFVAAYIWRVQYDNRPLLDEVYAIEYLGTFLMILPFWIIIFAMLDLYSSKIYNRRLVEWFRIIVGCFIGILLIIGCEYATGTRLFPARLVAVYALVGSCILIIIERELLRFLRSYLFKYGYGVSNVLVIGTSDTVKDIVKNLSETKKSGYNIIAVACPKKIFSNSFHAKHFSSVEMALKEIDTLGITTIIQTNLYDSPERNQKILNAAQIRHINYTFIPGETEFYSGKNTIDIFLGYPMITINQTPLMGWGAITKRIFDTIASAILIVLLSPLFLIIIVLQKILNPGPIFYTSKRLSRFSEPINLVKFRSMGSKYGKKDALVEFREMGREDLVEEYSKNFKVKHDPRITRFGHFLRKTSLDETPQLFSVLTGKLSLVGPRPIPKKELDAKFNKKNAAVLLSVKSGLTGLWQVSGRSNLTNQQRINIELFYAQNWSFWMDIKILFKTVLVVLFKKGAR